MTPNRFAAVDRFAKSAEGKRLLIVNTYEACLEFTQRCLAAMNDPAWGHVAKTAGEGQSVPPGFVPFTMDLIDDQGVTRTVTITGVSHDAIKHKPSGGVVDILGNGSANSDPDPAIHGPAVPQWAEVPAHHWRWNNPWIAAIPIGGGSPVPVPPVPPVPVPAPELPGREEMMNAGRWLHSYYRSPEGLQRPNGLWKPETTTAIAQPDWEGVGAWLFDVYLKARVAGKTATEAVQTVISHIRQTDEWRSKHPGETP